MRKKRQHRVKPQLIFTEDLLVPQVSPVKSNSFTLTQRLSQPVVTFVDMMATGTMTLQNLSLFNIPTPIQGILAASSAALMGAMHDIGAAVSHSCTRKHQSSRPCATLVTESAMSVLGLAAAASTGYGLTVLSDHYAPQLKASSNETIQSCGYLLTDAAVMGPVLAAIGYVGYRGVRALGMALSSYCVPGGAAVTYEHPSTLQSFGQLFHRLGVDVAITEIVLSQLKHWGHFSLAAEPRLQMGVFLGTDLAFNLIRHAAFVPKPIESLVSHQKERPLFIFDEEMGAHPAPAPSARDKTLAVVKYGTINTLLSGGAYALNELVCALSLTSLVCEDTALYRAARLAIPSTLIASKYVVEAVAPTVSKNISRCWSSLFQATPKRDDDAEEYEQLLLPSNNRP